MRAIHDALGTATTLPPPVRKTSDGKPEAVTDGDKSDGVPRDASGTADTGRIKLDDE